MSKNTAIFSVAASAIVLLIGGFWYTGSKQKLTAPKTAVAPSSQETHFATDIDPDVSHWQTKETEFFTIKFPKEWYWLESDLNKTGYSSQIITNNPDFDMNKYADIGVFTGGVFQIPLDKSEVVITTNGLGWATSNSGTPREFMDGKISGLKKDLYPGIKCHYTSTLESVPLTALCSFSDSNGQVVDTYYVSNIKRTFAYTARFSQGNSIQGNIESILENIAKNMFQKTDF